MWEESQANNFLELLQCVSLNSSEKDKWVWVEDQTGMYSTKSAYRVISSSICHSHNNDFFSAVWNLKIPSKVNFLLWRVRLN